MKPVIGIISSVSNLGVLPSNSTGHHYISAVAAAGGVPVQLPYTGRGEFFDEFLNICNGFLLPGGRDLPSSLFGEASLDIPAVKRGLLPKEICGFAVAAADKLLRSGKPVLGICLGCQLIAVREGGSLYQDIPYQVPSEIKHKIPYYSEYDRFQFAHGVRAEAGSMLLEAAGSKEFMVNSFHHQAIKTVPEGFTVSARATDGIIEAIECRERNILGVQWHPENLAMTGMKEACGIFDWLINASSK